MICLGVLEARESQNDRILLVESNKSKGIQTAVLR